MASQRGKELALDEQTAGWQTLSNPGMLAINVSQQEDRTKIGKPTTLHVEYQGRALMGTNTNSIRYAGPDRREQVIPVRKLRGSAQKMIAFKGQTG